MESSPTSWVHLHNQPPKRKRAEIACQVCHAKKVKCNLQERKREGLDNCSYCAASKRQCRPRQSKRERQRQQAQHDKTDSQPSTSPSMDTFDTGGNNVQASTTEQQSSTHTDPASGLDRAAEIPQHNPRGASNGHLKTNHLPSSSTGHLMLPADRTPQNLDLIQAAMTDSPLSSTNARNGYSEGYTVDTGFERVYEPEMQTDALTQQLANQERRILSVTSGSILISPSADLLQGFAETYFQHCYAFCPVLDIDKWSEDVSHSPLLSNALAVVGSHICPPLVPHAGPAAYYDRAKRLFYDEDEPDVMLSLKAVSLFYWWSPSPPTAIHRNTSWWWQSVIIRHAQQLGMHREPAVDHPRHAELNLSLRRKIWWTAFARERLTALCQSRPAIIDLEDCNIKLPTLEDFTTNETTKERKAEVFICWVKLCAIVGKIAKQLSRSSGSVSTILPTTLTHELISWVESVCPRLQLPIETAYTTSFDHDIHQLYLPYFASVIVLHLKHSSSSLPIAQPPAILAASCVARILKDVLARGSARALMGITCWYTGISGIALVAATRYPEIREGANEDLDILVMAIKQLKLMWPTANIFEQAFERLRAIGLTEEHLSDGPDPANGLASNCSTGAVDWIKLFPFVTPSTSKIADWLLRKRQQDSFPFDDANVPQSMISYLQEFFEPTDALNFFDLSTFS